MAAVPWYRSPPAWMRGGTNVWPSVCIFTRGVISPVSPKSYSYRPFVIEGTEVGSTAMKRVSERPWIRSPIVGYVKPAKFDPPPTEPTMKSGVTSASSNCFWASRPMTVWCRSTWFRTEPREYRVFGLVTAVSIASEIATPREPGWLGSWARIFFPMFVRSLGLGITSAP